MNKSELIEATAASSGLSKSDVAKALDSILEGISGAVQRGDRVSLSGFGTFERRERSARTGRNPQTGEELQVAASKAPAFKPAKAFKDAVNG
jgi:DNA-binding protein HU-beta